ncbi:MAG: ACP S-malonyltransferase [Parachlamydiales bacterium]
MSKIAFIFPGQGAQKVEMGLDFYQTFPEARAIFDRADEILGYPLTQIVFEGPQEKLTQTQYSQVALYVTSMAILEVLKARCPELEPAICAGLSLGEYTALTASGRLPFEECLPLVRLRGEAMSRACEASKGGMVAIIGLSAEQVEIGVKELNLPNDLWAANFNCPGQVVVSGTEKGIEAVLEAAKGWGAKRALPLQVHGAFHSGLMAPARQELAKALEGVALREGEGDLVMNVTGRAETTDVRALLAKQVTSPVRWEQSIREMDRQGVTLYIEIGPGKTLAGFNKRIGPAGETLSIEKVTDLEGVAICK